MHQTVAAEEEEGEDCLWNDELRRLLISLQCSAAAAAAAKMVTAELKEIQFPIVKIELQQ